MATKYEAPAQVRDLEKLISDFSYSNGFDTRTVFDDMLKYIMGNFTINPRPDPHWKYTEKQSEVFWKMFCTWLKIMDKNIKIKEWYDSFGDLFMSLNSKWGQANNGQFFTLEGICDLMVMVLPEGEPGQTHYDPCCGSGRLSIAHSIRNPGTYYTASDIDSTCCMMTTVNFLAHAVVGHVIWQNSLNPKSFMGGWAVNEILNTTGIPTIRTINEEEYFGTANPDKPNP